MNFSIFAPPIWFLAFVLNGRTITTGAYDKQSGAPIYTEIREQSDGPNGPGQWNFTYRDNTGNIIVRRTVDFSRDRIRPSFTLVDSRNGYREGAERIGDRIRVYSGGSADDPYQEAYLLVPEPAVVDAGFHFFVEQHFDRLMTGEKMKFYFVAPSQLDYYSFRVYKDRSVTHQGRPAVLFKMDIDNFFLRLFVDPIRLTYDQETRQLRVYEGISNIYNEQGKSYKVKMVFPL
jgi:hypothetical protein